MEELYHRLYHLLFNRITDALAVMETGDTEQGKHILIRAQQEAENLYITSQEGCVIPFPKSGEKQ